MFQSVISLESSTITVCLWLSDHPFPLETPDPICSLPSFPPSVINIPSSVYKNRNFVNLVIACYCRMFMCLGKISIPPLGISSLIVRCLKYGLQFEGEIRECFLFTSRYPYCRVLWCIVVA